MLFFDSSAKSKVKMADKRGSNDAAVSMLRSFLRRTRSSCHRDDLGSVYTVVAGIAEPCLPTSVGRSERRRPIRCEGGQPIGKYPDFLWMI